MASMAFDTGVIVQLVKDGFNGHEYQQVASIKIIKASDWWICSNK